MKCCTSWEKKGDTVAIQKEEQIADWPTVWRRAYVWEHCDVISSPSSVGILSSAFPMISVGALPFHTKKQVFLVVIKK